MRRGFTYVRYNAALAHGSVLISIRIQEASYNADKDIDWLKNKVKVM